MIVSWNWLGEYVARGESAVSDASAKLAKSDASATLAKSDASATLAKSDASATLAEVVVERLLMAGLNHESTTPVGSDLAIDLEVTSNRPDCLGHLGIAREIAALYGTKLTLPPVDLETSAKSIESLTSVTLDATSQPWCKQYLARVIQNVKVGPSPAWMQDRLRTIGVTPINNVVDVTNYVLFECGQPLHAYDYDKLAGKRIVVRGARKDEPFVAINNRTYALAEGMPTIADAHRAVALAGVMGGANTEVDANTRNVLLEAAEFDALAVRRTSRALDLSSDSSYRFERKIDPAAVDWASKRACHLIARLAGGQVALGVIRVGDPIAPPAPVTLRWRQIARVLGVDVAIDEARSVLESLGLTLVESSGDRAIFAPPSFRRDLTREIDLIEEIGRILGYHRIPDDRVIPLSVAVASKSDRVVAKLRQWMCGFGYFEGLNFSFADLATVESIRPWTTLAPLAVQHSSRRHEKELRQSLLPSLVHAMRFNEQQRNRDVRLFEIASAYLPRDHQTLPEEPLILGMASTGDLREVRGHVEFLLGRLGLPVELTPCCVQGLDDQRSAEWRWRGKRIGVLGVIARSVKEQVDLHGDVAVAEIRLDSVIEEARLVPRVVAYSNQPPVERDLNFVLEERVRWTQLEEVVRARAGESLETLEFVDLYRGKQVPDGTKSITLRMVFRLKDRTLTGEEVDGFVQQVVEAVSGKLGGRLR